MTTTTWTEADETKTRAAFTQYTRKQLLLACGYATDEQLTDFLVKIAREAKAYNAKRTSALTLAEGAKS